MKKVAVIGGGGTGCTIAADNTLRGNSVCLYEDIRYWNNLREIEINGGIEIVGQAINGFAEIDMLTNSMAEAVDEADIILISVVAARHEEICKELAPLLKSGQTVCFSAGNCGSIILRQQLEKIPYADIVVGEMQGNVYPCRLTDKAKVKSALPYKQKKVAAFPAKDNDSLVAELKGVYDCIPATNVLESTLNSPNVVVHLAGSILNTCSIERNSSFKLYKDGLSPSVIRCIEAVEHEKDEVMKAMGYEVDFHTPFIKQIAEYDKFRELDDFRNVSGPSSMKHRYITEDASTGVTILYSLAQLLKIETPCIRAFITMASVINEIDYFKTGKNLVSLGIEGLNPQEINWFLYSGKL